MINTEHLDHIKNLLQYLEAFSMANQLTNSVIEEKVGFNYTAQFGKYTLKIDATYDHAGFKAKIQHLSTVKLHPAGVRIYSSKGGEERKAQYMKIKGAIKARTSSYDTLKDTMLFVVTNIEDLNLVINTLNEEDE